MILVSDTPNEDGYYDRQISDILLTKGLNKKTAELVQELILNIDRPISNDDNNDFLSGIQIYQDVVSLVPKLFSNCRIHDLYLEYLFQHKFLNMFVNDISIQYSKEDLRQYFHSNFLPIVFHESKESDMQKLFLLIKEKNYRLTKVDLEEMLQSYLLKRESKRFYSDFLVWMNKEQNIQSDSQFKLSEEEVLQIEALTRSR